MFGVEPRLQAIIEILLLLILAAGIGWILGRSALSGRLRSIRSAVADKEAELEACRSGEEPIHKTERMPEPIEREVPEPAAFVHADPLLPAFSHDDTPDPIAVPPATASSIPDKSAYSEPVAPVDLKALAGNSEAAVLNRIASRASEVNFDRIGRATAAEADDLKDIVGIGPFLERKLHSLGIYTFRQVANFTKEDITKVNELIEFFPGRIDRDNWVDQAKGFYDKKYGDRP
jgi:predicted flap endonuclease-1-like 5' DNA nuclease